MFEAASDNEFPTFYAEEYLRLTRFLTGQGASWADAEDAAQQAMIALWSDWSKVSAPRAWVRKVAFRTFVKDKKAGASVAAEPVDAGASRPQDTADQIYETTCDFEVRIVREVLRALPSGQRVVMALKLDDFDTQEIADITGQKPVTVRSNLRHARQKVRVALEQRIETARKEGTLWTLTMPISTGSTSALSGPS